MRILHTSDWHLGHTLHGLSREYEHGRFLDWLVETVVRERIDALLICGDVFDTANPSAAAQGRYYRFLAAAHAAAPHLQIVVIAGNHDSAQRLQAPREILQAMRVHVVGDLRGPDGRLWMEHLVVPLRDGGGEVRAWCAAVPFLRPSDLRVSERPADPAAASVAGRPGPEARADQQAGTDPENEEPTEDPLIAGVARIYDAVLDHARAQRQPGQALLALGHCYMVGTEISALSERKILGGNLHALPVGMFPDDVDYVALGHLHKAQRVGQREHVRYSGSPIPLSMAEGRNRQQVTRMEVHDGAVVEIESLTIPRSVDLVRVPPQRAEPIEEVLTRLSALPAAVEFPDPATRPFLEVRVLLERPVAGLRDQIEARLADRAPRLLRIAVEYPAARRALAEVVEQPALQDLSPQDVFASLYRSRHGEEVPTPLVEALHELIDAVRQEGGA